MEKKIFLRKFIQKFEEKTSIKMESSKFEAYANFNILDYFENNEFLEEDFKSIWPSVDVYKDYERKIDVSIFFDRNIKSEKTKKLAEKIKSIYNDIYNKNDLCAKIRNRNGGYSVFVEIWDKNDPSEMDKLISEGIEILLKLLSIFSEYIFDESNLDFQSKIQNSMSESSSIRLERIRSKEKQPVRRKIVQTTVFERDPDIVAEALFQARGHCQSCKQPAPFRRFADGRPYLEVHHIVPLSEGGPDSLDNVTALCPNCHRDMHFGPKARKSQGGVGG
ncbi:HNH endonuclease [Teichococcus cervicalis]|nr:HNH endonuclease signature motif containing protein [Pseudoroseomonas cervicalis]